MVALRRISSVQRSPRTWMARPTGQGTSLLTLEPDVRALFLKIWLAFRKFTVGGGTTQGTGRGCPAEQHDDPGFGLGWLAWLTCKLQVR
jgi:hypothetical protein